MALNLRTRLTAVPIVLALLGAPVTARAAGISTARMGGEHGHPTATNPLALFYNPAGIAAEPGGRFFGDLIVAWRSASYERDPSATDDTVPRGAEDANIGQGELLNIIPSPALGATYQIDSLAFGLGAFVPYGGHSIWSERDGFADSPYPGAIDGPQRWYSIEGEIRHAFFTAGVAYDFGPVRFGAAFNLIWSVVDTLRARDPAGGNRLANEGRSWLDVESFDPSFALGALWDALPDERLVIGASYQSLPNVGGGLRLSGSLRTLLANGVESDDDVDFHTELPEVIRLGARSRVTSDVELRLFGDLQTWSVLDDHCITERDANCEIAPDGSATSEGIILNQRRAWNDTFGVRASGSYFLPSGLELFAGTGYSSNAVPDETLEPALMDFHSMHVAGGVRHEVLTDVRLAASYTQVIYFSRDTRGKSIHPELDQPSTGPDSGGRYSQQLGFVDVNVEIAF